MEFLKGLFKKEKKSSCCGDLDTQITKAKEEDRKEEKKEKKSNCGCSFNLEDEIAKAKNK